MHSSDIIMEIDASYLLAEAKDNIRITASCVTVCKVDPTHHAHLQEAYQPIHDRIGCCLGPLGY